MTWIFRCADFVFGYVNLMTVAFKRSVKSESQKDEINVLKAFGNSESQIKDLQTNVKVF